MGAQPAGVAGVGELPELRGWARGIAVRPVGQDLVGRADAAGDQQHGSRGDARHDRKQRGRLAHARDPAHGLRPDGAEGALCEPRVADAAAVHRPCRPVGDDCAQPRLARGGLEQHLGAEGDPEAGDLVGVHVGPPRQPADRGVHRWLGVGAEPVRVTVALAVAWVVDREYAVAVAGEHADVRGHALAAAARAVAEQHGGPVVRRDVPAGQPPPVRGLERDLLVGDPERGLLDRPARRVRDHQRHGEGHQREHREDGRCGEPAGPMGEPPSERRAAGRPPRSRDGGQAGGDEQDSADDHAHAGEVGECRTRVHNVKAVRDDAESHRQQPDDDAEDESRRTRDVRLDGRRGDRDRDDREHTGKRGVRTGEGQVEQVQDDQSQPREQERAFKPRHAHSATALWPRAGDLAFIGERCGHACKPPEGGRGAAWGTAGVRAPVGSRRGWGQPYLASRGGRRQDGPMTARRTLAIAAAALLCGVGDVLLVLASEHFPDPEVWAVFGPLVGWSFVGTGLYAWRRRPESRFGRLMVAGRVRVVPRAAVRLRPAARVHGRHRAQRPLGPGLRPPPAELPDRTAADARATPARGGELRADPARAGPGSAGQRRRRGDQRLPRRMPAQRPAHLGRAEASATPRCLRLAGDARPLPRGGRMLVRQWRARRRARAPQPRPAVRRRRGRCSRSSPPTR